MDSSSSPPEAPMAPPPPPPPGGFQRPADYYESPPAPEGKKGCPRWLLYGCGGLGCLGLLVIFGVGIWMMRGGGAKLTGFIVTQLQRDAERLFEEDVPAEDRERLEDALTELKERIDSGQLDMMVLQPVLTEINQAIRDRKLTTDEVRSLTDAIEQLNETAASTPVSVRARPAGTRAAIGVFALAG